MKQKEALKPLIGFILLGVMFFCASILITKNSDLLKLYINDTFSGMVIYISILVISAVIAPVDVIFLMPIATSTWGWVTAAVLSLIGWSLGSAAVFLIARRYGVPLIQKHLPLQKIYKYEKMMPQKNIFAGIISLRIAMPIDLVSYAIGLFTNIKFLPYFLATFIGYIPMAFFLSFLGTLPIFMQFIGLLIFLIVALVSYMTKSKRINKEK